MRFLDPVDFYTLVTRAVKYGILFVTLAFLAMFCMELVAGRRVHSVQYLFTGVALAFFYVLLLSFAEHIGFALAYGLASASTGLMLAVYIGAVLSSLRQGRRGGVRPRHADPGFSYVHSSARGLCPAGRGAARLYRA